MKLTTHFLNEPTPDLSGARCLCCPEGEFVSVWEAARSAMKTAEAPDLNAQSFFITDEQGNELARWQRTASTWWKVR